MRLSKEELHKLAGEMFTFKSIWLFIRETPISTYFCYASFGALSYFTGNISGLVNGVEKTVEFMGENPPDCWECKSREFQIKFEEDIKNKSHATYKPTATPQRGHIPPEGTQTTGDSSESN